jgi:uncharacterized protein YhfF
MSQASSNIANMEARSHSDIYIDAKQGTVPLTALYDCANNLLRMSKDGQRVIIQNHSAKGSMIITLTRVSMGNFKEEVNFDIPPKL